MRPSTFGDIRRGERSRKPRHRRPADLVEGLERKDLLTAGAVAVSGASVVVTPPSTGPSTTVVSYQQHNGTTMLDVNLNSVNHFYNTSQITSVYYLGNHASGSQSFTDSTNLNVYALGGSGTNVFQGGSGYDTFYGGSGENVFNAGTGFDVMVSGGRSNVFNENASGFGIIEECGGSITINTPPDQVGGYMILVG